MNLPKRAQDAHSTLATAFNTGDVATVMSMYDATGIIVAQPGQPVSGKEKFEQAIKAILSDGDDVKANRGGKGCRPGGMGFGGWECSCAG